MARPEKSGLDYFPFDVDFFNDEKIEAISGEFGIKGEIATIKLLSAIYRNGYFIEWSEMLKMKLLKNLNGISKELLEQIVARLVRWNFFDENLFNSGKILTSKGIQRRYEEATKRRKNNECSLFWLLDDVNVNINTQDNAINVNINTQSKVKESKVKESKLNNINVEVNTTPSVDFNFEKFILFFNKNRGNISEVKKLSETRKRKIKSIYLEFSKEDIQKVVLKAKESNFLQGLTGKRDWIASFDWMLEKRNFIKILEGNYDNRTQNLEKNENGSNDTIGRASIETLRKNAEYTGSY